MRSTGADKLLPNKHRVQGTSVINYEACRPPNGAHPGSGSDILPLCHASHRWEGNELLLHDIQEKVSYELKVGGIVKFQLFCKTARNAGYHWAWVDTCCIDQNNNVELQLSLNFMFVWYHHSALTIIYLSDVPSS